MDERRWTGDERLVDKRETADESQWTRNWRRKGKGNDGNLSIPPICYSDTDETFIQVCASKFCSPL